MEGDMVLKDGLNIEKQRQQRKGWGIVKGVKSCFLDQENNMIKDNVMQLLGMIVLV